MIEPFVVRGYEPQTFYQPKREKMMKDKNIEKELHPTLSKLTEEQFRQLRNILNDTYGNGFEVEGFHQNLNLELLTKCMERLNFYKEEYPEMYVGLTDEECISIIKEYGSVSNFISVSGSVESYSNFVEHYKIPAEKIEELGVGKIQSWGDFDNLEEILGINLWEEAERFVDIGDREIVRLPELSGVKVFTKVKVVVPTPDVFAEKEVNL